VPHVVEGLSALGAEVVIAVSKADRDALGELADGVRIIEEVPLHLVLPTCEAIVHHGGSGTVQTAAALGVPQITIPEINDQSYNGIRLQAVGAGRWIAEGDVTTEKVVSVADEVLNGGQARAAAEELRAAIDKEPSPAEIVTRIERMV
jgi:UDP:flavonoid glycosyltransferase YjiC (YdhE family)